MPNLHLCDLDLNKNALLNPVIHPVGTAPSNPVEGQIYYDNTGGDKQIYVYNGSGWISMGGDVTSVIAGTGLTGGGTGGAVTLNVIGGTGITANANDIAIDSTVATLSGSQTLTNKTIAASQVTEISNLTAAEGAQLEAIGTTTISATQWGYLGAATGAITNTDTQLSTEAVQDIVGAMTTSNTESGITVAYQDADGTLDFTVGTLNQNTTGSAATLTTARTIGGVSFNGSANIDLPGVNTAGNQATSGNAATATKISSITNSNIVQLAASQTLTNKTIAASQVTEISNITAAEGAQIENIGTTTISATQWGYLGAATGAITNVNDDVSVPNLKTALAGGFAGNAVTIGDSSDVVTIGKDLTVTGDLIVSGTTTTLNTANLTVEDNNIILSSGNTTGAAINGAGITLEGGSGSDATITYNTTGPKFEMKLGSNYEDLKVDTLIGDVTGDVTGDLTGNADTVTTNANLTGHITSSGNAAVLGSFTSAQLKAALTNETGSGAAVFATSPTLVTPALGTPASGVMTNVTGTATNLNIGGNAATSTKISSITNSNIVQLAGSQTLTGTKTLNSFKGTGGATVTNILDEDNMASDSATALATQQSIKAYVDDTTAAGVEGKSIAYSLAHATTGVAGNSGSADDNNVFTITHGLGSSLHYLVQIIASDGGATVFPCVTRTTTTVVVTFNANVTAGAYIALIVKI